MPSKIVSNAHQQGAFKESLTFHYQFQCRVLLEHILRPVLNPAYHVLKGLINPKESKLSAHHVTTNQLMVKVLHHRASVSVSGMISCKPL